MQKVIILMLCNGEKILYNNDTRDAHAQGYACGGRSFRIKKTTKKAAAQEHAPVSGKKENATMADRGSSKKKNTNSAAYILLAAGGIALLIVIIAIVMRFADRPEPSQSATPTPTYQNTESPVYTQQSTVTPENTQAVDPGPTSDIALETLNVPADKVFAVHLTVDSGEMREEDPVFDEEYSVLEQDDTDYTDVKMLVFLTDYRGNSKVYRFDTAEVTIRLKSFLLPGGEPKAIEELSEANLRVDAAQNLHITWAGQKAYINGEGTGASGITAQSGTCELTLQAKPLGLLDKSRYQH